MPIPYPLNAPCILNDATFVQYGGHTGSSVAAQRNAAYLMAEMAASRDLSTLMMPVIVTGTYHIQSYSYAEWIDAGLWIYQQSYRNILY